MSEHPNAAAFRQAIADLMQGNLETFGDLLSTDVVWHEAGNPRPLRGRDAVMDMFAGLLGSGLEFEDELHEVLANDEHLVALIWGRIRKGDGEIVYPVVEVAHFRDGKMTERWALMDAVPEDVTAFFSD